jgi:hypothetical protein
LTASRGSNESPSRLHSVHSGTFAVPPLSKSRLPREEFVLENSGRMWCMSVPGPALVVRSPWLCAQVCSRFQESDGHDELQRFEASTLVPE